MPRIKTAPSVGATVRKPIHYHVVLRPVLQRRFARSSLWTLVVCCVVSYLISDRYSMKSLVVSWVKADNELAFRLLLPWSATLVRGFVLFGTLFPVLILRKADLQGAFADCLAVLMCSSSILSSCHSVLRHLQRIPVDRRTSGNYSLHHIRSFSDISIPPQSQRSGHALNDHQPVCPCICLILTENSGYELPRLNERLLYLLYFSICTPITYGLFQRAVHRTLLPYTSVSVSFAAAKYYIADAKHRHIYERSSYRAFRGV
jgi:hypothetical protein